MPWAVCCVIVVPYDVIVQRLWFLYRQALME